MSDPSISISVPLSQVNLIINALAQRPWAEADPVIRSVTQQAQEAVSALQVNPAQAPPKDE